MKKWQTIGLLVGATVLGATVLNGPIATAAQSISATITGPLDGQGNVKVHEQGTATVSGTVVGRPAAPSEPWKFNGDGEGEFLVAGPDTAINVTSLTVSHRFSGQDESVLVLRASSVADTASACEAEAPHVVVWQLAQITEPFSVSFPTPLQITAPPGRKACLAVLAAGSRTLLDISGFYGS